MAKITPKHYPSVATVEQVNPAALAKLPADYEGAIDDLNLAFSLCSALERMTFTELTAIKVNVPEDMTSANEKKFAREYLRFGLPEQDTVVYYDFLSAFQTNQLSADEIFYAVAIYSNYRDNVDSVLSVLTAILTYQKQDLGRDKAAVVLPSISELENFFALQTVLRSEALIIKPQYVWLASSHWDSKDVITLLEEGLDIRRAMELYVMGFTTVEDILTYSDLIPSSWIDRIMTGPPTVNS